MLSTCLLNEHLLYIWETAFKKPWTWGLLWCGGPCRPRPQELALIPLPLRTCAPPFLPYSPTASGRNDGPHDIHFISCFLYVHLGCPIPSPQKSKYTLKNEQAICGNNIHDIQEGRQEINDEIKDIRGRRQRAERVWSPAHRLW